MTRPQLTIAICDDDPAALVLMEELVKTTVRLLSLELDDVEVLPADDYRKAEEIAASGEADLLITDLMWPVTTTGEEFRQGFPIAESAKIANRRTVVVIITSKDSQEQNFRDEARRRGADLALTWDEAFGNGKFTSAQDLAVRLGPRTAAVPEVLGSDRLVIGLVGVDTVAFSEEGDEVQEAVVRSFLHYMNEAWVKVPHGRSRPIFVFTGDGLFLGITGDDGPRRALDVAVFAWRRFNHLAKYGVRLAVHSGPVNVLSLSTGAEQLLGHSVNWLFRAVNAAEVDGLVVTEDYYNVVLQGGREEVAGLQFGRRETMAKHVRPLVVFDVSEA